jgi:hypothetical protein
VYRRLRREVKLAPPRRPVRKIRPWRAKVPREAADTSSSNGLEAILEWLCFFEHDGAPRAPVDYHREEHTGSDPGSQCLRSWSPQDSRGCRSDRVRRWFCSLSPPRATARAPARTRHRLRLPCGASGRPPSDCAPSRALFFSRSSIHTSPHALECESAPPYRVALSGLLGRRSPPPPAQAGEARSFVRGIAPAREDCCASASGPPWLPLDRACAARRRPTRSLREPPRGTAVPTAVPGPTTARGGSRSPLFTSPSTLHPAL